MCSGTTPQEACGGRIFAEPYLSATFVQFDNKEYENGIKALAAAFPRYVKVTSLEDLLGDHSAKSAGGRPLWVIEVTDFEAPESKKAPVMVSLSVHGNERAGLEGGVRYAEDLARWATSDPAHILRNGTDPDSSAFRVTKVLKRVHLYLADINPDGWAKGDVGKPLFSRTNDRNTDLNREFPTLGWSKNSYTPLSDPESIAWERFTRQIQPVVASDLHGELTSVNNAFADMMYPAGQWDPQQQLREDALARHMKSNVNRYFAEQNVVLGPITGVAGMRPADYATGYDVVGYDDSGFMGDFFTQVGAVEMDVEHFLSHTVPNNAWVWPLEQAHIAAVRAEIEADMVESMVTKRKRVVFDLGRVGYLFDPHVVTDTDADGYGGPTPREGYTPKSYSVTPMRYFEDLSRFNTEPLTPILTGDVSPGALDGLDSLVVSDDPFPADADGRAVDRSAYAAAIKDYVERGGNLVLTDSGLKLLDDLGVVPASAIAKSVSNAGHVDIDDFDDTYTSGLAPTASQTYYEVPLGFLVSPNNTARHWTVAKAAWEGAGGLSIAHVDNAARIGLGRIEVGKGTIGILGALLPTPTEEFDHYYGLADYGVTVAGGMILNRMIDPIWSSTEPAAPILPLARY